MLIECWLLSAMVILEAFIQLKCRGTNFQCLSCETLTISQPFNHKMLKRQNTHSKLFINWLNRIRIADGNRFGTKLRIYFRT